MTNKELILSVFDKAISKNKALDTYKYSVCFVVLILKKYGGAEAVVADGLNLERKRKYLNEQLNDDGYYLNSNNTVRITGAAADLSLLIGSKIDDLMSDTYSQVAEIMKDAKDA